MPPTADTNASAPLDRSQARTTVIATYQTRRDAEMAQMQLEAEDLRTLITADDAGGMHVQMQLTNGVKLVGLEDEVDEARALLDDAGMLPDTPPAGDDTYADHSPANELLLYGGLALTVCGAYLWWSAAASPFAAYLFAGPGAAAALTGWLRR